MTLLKFAADLVAYGAGNVSVAVVFCGGADTVLFDVCPLHARFAVIKVISKMYFVRMVLLFVPCQRKNLAITNYYSPYSIISFVRRPSPAIVIPRHSFDTLPYSAHPLTCHIENGYHHKLISLVLPRAQPEHSTTATPTYRPVEPQKKGRILRYSPSICSGIIIVATLCYPGDVLSVRL